MARNPRTRRDEDRLWRERVQRVTLIVKRVTGKTDAESFDIAKKAVVR